MDCLVQPAQVCHQGGPPGHISTSQIDRPSVCPSAAPYKNNYIITATFTFVALILLRVPRKEKRDGRLKVVRLTKGYYVVITFSESYHL